MFLPGESHGQGSLVGCRLWGHTESDTTEVTWQQCSIVYMYHSFLIHSSADGHLGCFPVLAIINSAAVNIGVHVSLSRERLSNFISPVRTETGFWEGKIFPAMMLT